MSTKALVLCYLVIAMVFIAGPLPLAAESDAVPGSISWGSWDKDGSTAYGVYNSDNVTPLQPGCFVQLIWAGPDRQIDVPRGDGSPSDDDQILDTSTVRNGNLRPALWNLGYIPYQIHTYELTGVEDPRFAGVIYIRAWNAPAPGAPARYGDSTTGILGGYMGQQWKALRWYTPENPLAVRLLSFTATSDGDDVTLAWETESETDLRGFNLHRRTATGAWQQLNAVLIPCANPGGTGGGSYRLVDRDAPTGVRYTYRLDEVQAGGGVRTLGETSVYHGTLLRRWLPVMLH